MIPGMGLVFYNSASRQLEPFEPRIAGEVRMYNCGPTVYKSQHIGNFRSYLLADLLRRHLEMRGFEVTQIMNITDVGHLTEDDIEAGEDKMLASARREKLDPYAVARKYEDEFKRDAKKLRLLEAHEYPRATEHIAEMIEMVQMLLDKGYAYNVGGNVYFEQSKFADFGKLSGKKIHELKEGARVEVNPEKRDPRDFALWKVDEKHLMQWDAPWGRGFPGWHIECSAMSRKYLGDEIDIHTGGEDNLFPHHECEIAQSEAATGHHPFVRYWLHTRHLLVDGAKMSKSKDNFYTIDDLLEKGWNANEIRFTMMRVHYRVPVNFTFDGLADSRSYLARVRECWSRMVRIREGIDAAGSDAVEPVIEAADTGFGAALDEDLNISEALAKLSAFVADLNRLTPTVEGARHAAAAFQKFDDWIACLGDEPAVVRQEDGVSFAGPDDAPERAQLIELTLARQAAREAREWARADALRDEITALGYRVVDAPEGPRIEPK